MASLLYQPLPSPHHIRVLDFSGGTTTGKQSEEVQCGLHLLDLKRPDGVGAYDALSYTWQSEPGEPDGFGKIICAGHELHIGRNLFEALSQLRLLSEVKFLWADAICINQDDLQERAEQVKLMGSVFHKARRVHCWLGIGDDEARLALYNAGRLGRAFKEKLLPSEVAWSVETRPRFNDPALFERIQQRPLSELEWYGTGRIFGRAWFSRGWTFQEWSLAISSTIWIGNQSCPGVDLAVFVDHIGTMGWAYPIHDRCGFVSVRGFSTFLASGTLRLWQEDRSLVPNAIPRLTVEATRLYGNQAQNTEVLSGYMVEKCRGRSVSDPRDCIFAPLAMVVVYLATMRPGWEAPEPTTPGYAMSAAHIYVDFTKWLIEGTRNLNIIGQAEKTLQYDEAATLDALGQRLPSWTPDYSNPAKRSLMPSRSRTAFDPVTPVSEWDACDGKPLAYSFVDQQSRLHLNGYRLAIVRVSQLACFNRGYRMPNIVALAEDVYGEDTSVDWVQILAEVLAGGSPMIPRDREEFKVLFGMVIATDSTMSEILELLFYGYEMTESGSEVDAEHIRVFERAEKSSFWPSRGQLRFWFEEYDNALDEVDTSDPIALHGNATLMSIEQRIAPYHNEVASQCNLRCLIATDEGCLGLAPDTCKPGDEVWLLPGLNAPMVLRALGNGNHQVVGEAYVHGRMMGEPFRDGTLRPGEAIDVVLE